MVVTGELVKSYLEDMTKTNIQLNAETICEKVIKEPRIGFFDKLTFHHKLHLMKIN